MRPSIAIITLCGSFLDKPKLETMLNVLDLREVQLKCGRRGEQLKYSGDLKSDLVWISNGPIEFGLQMVWISNGISNPKAQCISQPDMIPSLLPQTGQQILPTAQNTSRTLHKHHHHQISPSQILSGLNLFYIIRHPNIQPQVDITRGQSYNTFYTLGQIYKRVLMHENNAVL